MSLGELTWLYSQAVSKIFYYLMAPSLAWSKKVVRGHAMDCPYAAVVMLLLKLG